MSARSALPPASGPEPEGQDALIPGGPAPADAELEALRSVLRDVERCRTDWAALHPRISRATAQLMQGQTTRKRGGATRLRSRAHALLDLSASACEVTTDAVSKVSRAGAALLEQCESDVADNDRTTCTGTAQRRQRQGTSGSSGVWQLVMQQLDDDRDTIFFGMRSGLGLGLGVGAGCAIGWILLLPLHWTILATTVCSLLVGLMFGPMASAAFGRQADGIVGRLCLMVFLCSGAMVCWSRIFRPATVESFRDAIVDITAPVQHSGTGQTVGLPGWGCVAPNMDHSEQTTPHGRDNQAICAAFYSCVLLELRNAVGETYAAGAVTSEAALAAASRRHDRLVDALEYRTVNPVSIILLLLQSNASNSFERQDSRSWLPPVLSTVSVCGRQFIGVDDSLWWPVPTTATASAEKETWEQQQAQWLVTGFAYRKGRVAHHSLLWQMGVLDWLANLLAIGHRGAGT